MKLTTLGLMIACGVALGACSKNAPGGDPPTNRSAGAHGDVRTASFDRNDPNVVTISVPTMQCDNCANTITRGLKTMAETKNVDVDVDNKTVYVQVANKTADTPGKLEAKIAACGYSTPGVQRDAAAYDKLPDCCKEGGHKE